MNEQDVTSRYATPTPEGVAEGPPVDNALELPEGMPEESFKLEPFAYEVQDGDRRVPVDFAMTQYGFVYGPVLVTRRVSDPKDGWVMLELASARDAIHVKVSKSGNARIWQNGQEITSKKAKKSTASQEIAYEQAVSALHKAVTEAQDGAS